MSRVSLELSTEQERLLDSTTQDVVIGFQSQSPPKDGSMAAPVGGGGSGASLRRVVPRWWAISKLWFTGALARVC